MAVSTLVIGVGGTGTLTVRAVKKYYDEMLPEDVREAPLPADKAEARKALDAINHKYGRVPASFLALDFDRSALLGDDDQRAFAPLSEEDFLYLNPNGIQELLRNIDRTYDNAPAWERILRWFPDREKVSIPTSEVEANGASQLRALGRLGFFLNDELIESTLRRKLGQLGGEVDTVRLSTAKRVILVSSLAGGTGGGTLLDMAYLARRQEGRPKVFLYLLLPEVFVDVDSGGRLMQNTYGFLKELAYLKDQQIAFDGDYLRIAPIHAGVGREEPFARLFLFGGHNGEGSASIQKVCQRLASAVLGQLQRTIQEKTLAVVSNTISGSRAEEEQRRRTHCFSTAGSGFIELDRTQLSAETLVHHVAGEVLRVSDADFDGDPEVRQLLNGLVSRLEEALRLEPSTSTTGPAAGGEPPYAEAEATATTKPTGASAQIETVVKAWKGYIDAAVRENAKLVVQDLEKLLGRAHLGLRAAAGQAPVGADARPEPGGGTPPRGADLSDARADIDLLRALALVEYNEANYETNLQNIKRAAPSFERYDASVRAAVRAFFPALEAAIDVRERQARRQFFKSLDGWDSRFRVRFSEGWSKEIQALDEAWKRRAGDRAALAPRRRTLWEIGGEREEAINAAYLDHDDLKKALGDESLPRHIADILKVRAYKEWKARLDEVRRKVEEDWRDYQRPFEDLPLPERQSGKINDLPPDVKARLQVAVREQLPRLVQVARELQDLDPLSRKHKLVALIEDLRRRVPEFRDVQFHLGDGFADDVREALVRARQSVFERRTPNPQRKGFTVMLVPYGLFGDEQQKQLKDFLASTAVQILDSRCQVEHYSGDRIWIYYEDLFNPPEHLKNLDEYYRVYSDERYKELFHLDRRYLDNPVFKEIHSGMSRSAIVCGNHGCRHNIAGVPRGERLCPSCGKPIRSRCGNVDCGADNLQDDARGTERLCPRCGDFNHGAWWRCERHGKVEHAVPVDKERCPRCIEQHLEDPIGFPADCISVRPDLRDRVQCPRCLDLQRERPDHPVFTIPRELLPFYRDGVNGHQIAKFPQQARQAGLADTVRCPNCRTVLIPVHHLRWQRTRADDPCAAAGRDCTCLAAERPSVTRSC